jgi:LysM repeat protein
MLRITDMRLRRSHWASLGTLIFWYASACCAHAASAAPATPPRSLRTRVVRARDDTAPVPEPNHSPPFAAWLRERLPTGGRIVVDDAGTPTVVHVVQTGETLQKVAAAYLDLADVYLLNDFVIQLGKANPRSRSALVPGTELVIPHLIQEPYKTGDAQRLGWPEDKIIRGIYMRGDTAGSGKYVPILDKLALHGMNAVVLDTKDTDGWLTYHSTVPLAVETNATKNAAIRDLPRAIRFAHARGIRVIMRISCFHDEWIQPKKTELSVRGKWGGPYPIGWLDPSSEGAHQYVISLAKEAMDAGADEIQLDYVRYPVIGTKNADFHLKERNLTRIGVIRDFVREVHEVTHARGVPLSLDVFGVVALGKRIDIDALGQDLVLLAPECEVLSPMVYPSHYSKGFYGFDEPGAHPELIGVGTKGTLDQIAHVPGAALVRPWLQAMNYESPGYGPEYLRSETKHAETAGGTGWLMWNPGQDYSYAWQIMHASQRASSQHRNPVE